jgi:uncharacterized protein DUF6064
MNIPFTTAQFFDIFTLYNESVWPAQIILNVLALAVVILLYRARRSGSRIIVTALSFFWAWMAVAYHFAFFTHINPAAWLFGAVFLAGAAWFAWIGVFTNELRFLPNGGVRGWTGAALILFSLLLYPLLGHLVGHRYPAVPTFGLPCPTTIFTIGVLLFAAPPIPRSVFIVPVLWAAVGTVGAFQFGVLQDLGLLVAGFAGVAAAILTPSQTIRAVRPDARRME